MEKIVGSALDLSAKGFSHWTSTDSMSAKPLITSLRYFHQPVQAEDQNDLEKSYCRIAHKNGQIKSF